MKIDKRLYILLLCALSFFIANAAVTFKAQQPGTIIEGDRFQITFTLEGAQGENFNGPQLNNCELLSDHNVSSSTSVTIINGKRTDSYRYDYICVYHAKNAGKVNVPSVSITVNGKQYKSQPFSFEIHKNTGAPNQHINQNTQSYDEIDASPKSISEAKSKTFMKVILSKNSVYEQEPIECKFKLYTQNKVQGVSPATLTLNDFLIEELPIKLDKVDVEEFNGQRYNTVVLKRLILYPQKSGSLKIETGDYTATVTIPQVVNMMGMQYIQHQPIPIKISDDISLEVLPLPSPRPTNFSGAVGNFSINSNVSSSSLRTNETATYAFTITGSGNIKYIKEPSIKFPSEFELYAPKSNADVECINGQIEGTVTFDYSFMPLSVGKYQIPAHEFIYFDPDKKEYITLTTSPTNIIVNKGVASVSNDDAKKRNDINDLKLGDKGLSKNPSIIVCTLWYWLIYVFIILIYISFLLFIKKKPNQKSNMKLAKANKIAMKRLKLANEYMLSNKEQQFYEEIINALWGYLSDKLAIPTSQLIRDNIKSELSKYGADESLCEEVIDILNLCDMAIYAPQSATMQTQVVYNRTIDIINKIESIKRK